MTVAELIKTLELVEDKSQLVVVNGYEGGYNDVHEAKPIQIVLNYHKEWFYGAHEGVEEAKMDGRRLRKWEKVAAIKIR